jgi:hypothetical protein
MSDTVLNIESGNQRLIVEEDNTRLVIPNDSVKFIIVATQGPAGVSPDLELDVPLIDGEISGFSTVEFLAGYTTAVGELVYLDSSTTWSKSDANDESKCKGLLGIVMEVKNTGEPVLVALPGSFIYSSLFPSLTTGGPIYIGENEGEITVTQPTTSNAVVRVIGWGISNNKMYFYPSPDYITLV